MKIFHEEDGKEVVYVQLQDIMYLIHEINDAIPVNVYEAANENPMVNDSNRFNFVRFEEKRDVQYFKGKGFILDYNQYKDFSEDEFYQEEMKLVTRANRIAEQWNSMTRVEQTETQGFLAEYQEIEYILNFLRELYLVTIRRKQMPFPAFVAENN